MALSAHSSSLKAVQTQLASHIRNPEQVPAPGGIEQRRLQIYRDLFYNNIENFISNGFPVLRSLYSDEAWHAMVREFMVAHRCHSPYFLEISQEFLLYLQQERGIRESDPLFIQELAHYEWVELALDVAEEELSEFQVDPAGDLITGAPVVSPLAWSLAYQYPVHKIGQGFQPQEPEAMPSYLVVYRNREDKVGFMEANSVTARLLELLQQNQHGGLAVSEAIERELTVGERTKSNISGYQALAQIAEEMQHPNPDQVITGGTELLLQLRSLDIILGTR